MYCSSNNLFILIILLCEGVCLGGCVYVVWVVVCETENVSEDRAKATEPLTKLFIP